jgi:anti-anti-sigma regulatory factor
LAAVVRSTMETWTRAGGGSDRMHGLRVDRASDGVVYLTGELDRDAGRDLEVRIVHVADDDDSVVVDLRNVFSWDTIGISALLRLAKIVHPARVVLRSPPTNLANVLDLVGLDGFAICPGDRTTDRVLEMRTRA